MLIKISLYGRSESLICLMAIMFFSSCIKEIQVPESIYEHRMVISGVLVPGEITKISLRSTVPMGSEGSPRPIEDASVKLFHGEQIVGSFQHDSIGFYSLSADIVEGETYMLTASAQGYPSIEAHTTVPTSKQFSVSIGVDTLSQNRRQQIMVQVPASASMECYAVMVGGFSRQVDTVAVSWYDWDLDEWFINPGRGIWYLYSQYTASVVDPLGAVEYCYSGGSDTLRLADFTHPSDSLPAFSAFLPGDAERPIATTYFFSNRPFIGEEYELRISDFFSICPLSANESYYLYVYQLSTELYETFRGYSVQMESQVGQLSTPIAGLNYIEGGLGYFGSTLIQTIDVFYCEEEPEWMMACPCFGVRDAANYFTQ